MRKGLRRRRWTWMVAGALGLTTPALAQPAVPPPTTATVPARHSTAEPDRAEELHRAEIKVKLAWLADPITYRHLLAVQSQGEGLKVEGFVPSEKIRARALELARLESGLPVVDALHVQPRMTARVAVPCPVEATARAAAALLFQACGDQARDFAVSVRNDGQVTVLGWIDSDEAKLAVSQRLCRLDGCTSINNQLRVPARLPVRVAAGTSERQEPRPLPSSLLTVAAPTVSPASPTRAAADPDATSARPVLTIAADFVFSSDASRAAPTTPEESVALPRIISGPRQGDEPLAAAPRIYTLPGGSAPRPPAATDPSRPGATGGNRIPEVISTPLRLPEIRAGVGWPMRSILEFPPASDRRAAPVQRFEPAGSPASGPAAVPLPPGVPGSAARPQCATLVVPKPPAPPAGRSESKPVPPGDPYVATGVMTFMEDAPAGGTTRPQNGKP